MPKADTLRRATAVGTAVALVLEALVIAFVNWILGLLARHQQMSMGGLGSGVMATASWVLGGAFALFLVYCAVLVLRIAVHDRMAGPVGRIVLIVCAVTHGLVGALVVGLIGWYAFALMMVILALQVGTLLMYAPEDRATPRPAAAEPAGEAPPATA